MDLLLEKFGAPPVPLNPNLTSSASIPHQNPLSIRKPMPYMGTSTQRQHELFNDSIAATASAAAVPPPPPPATTTTTTNSYFNQPPRGSGRSGSSYRDGTHNSTDEEDEEYLDEEDDEEGLDEEGEEETDEDDEVRGERQPWGTPSSSQPDSLNSSRTKPLPQKGASTTVHSSSARDADGKQSSHIEGVKRGLMPVTSASSSGGALPPVNMAAVSPSDLSAKHGQFQLSASSRSLPSPRALAMGSHPQNNVRSSQQHESLSQNASPLLPPTSSTLTPSSSSATPTTTGSSNMNNNNNNGIQAPLSAKDKRKKKKLPTKKLLNTCFTKYPVIREVADDLGFTIDATDDELEKNDANLVWSDTVLPLTKLVKLHNWQRSNHFPSMHLLCRKGHLGLTLGRMRKHFPTHFNFFPRTWSMRSEKGQFARMYAALQGVKKVFILKPNAGCQGRGIVLSKDPLSAVDDLDNYVVQEYVSRPLLIERKKFDLRVYCLLTSVRHPSIFLFNDGLVRMCAEDYEKPNDENMSNSCKHLTNYAVNKHSEQFVFNNDREGRGDTGNKRDFRWFDSWLDAAGHSSEKFWDRVQHMLVKTILAAQPQMLRVYNSCFPHNNDGFTCFEVLGFDILVDDRVRPVLMEVNHTPSLTCDTPLDHRIKHSLVTETWNIINIQPTDKQKHLEREKRQFTKRMQAAVQSKLQLLRPNAVPPSSSGVQEELYSGKTQSLDSFMNQGNSNAPITSQLLADFLPDSAEQMAYEKRQQEDQRLVNYRRIYPTTNIARQALYETILATAKAATAVQTTAAQEQRQQEAKNDREKREREKQQQLGGKGSSDASVRRTQQNNNNNAQRIASATRGGTHRGGGTGSGEQQDNNTFVPQPPQHQRPDSAASSTRGFSSDDDDDSLSVTPTPPTMTNFVRNSSNNNSTNNSHNSTYSMNGISTLTPRAAANMNRINASSNGALPQQQQGGGAGQPTSRLTASETTPGTSALQQQNGTRVGAGSNNNNNNVAVLTATQSSSNSASPVGEDLSQQTTKRKKETAEKQRAKLAEQMERHRRRMVLGPRLSVFQLREVQLASLYTRDDEEGSQQQQQQGDEGAIRASLQQQNSSSYEGAPPPLQLQQQPQSTTPQPTTTASMQHAVAAGGGVVPSTMTSTPPPPQQQQQQAHPQHAVSSASTITAAMLTHEQQFQAILQQLNRYQQQQNTLASLASNAKFHPHGSHHTMNPQAVAALLAGGTATNAGGSVGVPEPIPVTWADYSNSSNAMPPPPAQPHGTNAASYKGRGVSPPPPSAALPQQQQQGGGAGPRPQLLLQLHEQRAALSQQQQQQSSSISGPVTRGSNGKPTYRLPPSNGSPQSTSVVNINDIHFTSRRRSGHNSSNNSSSHHHHHPLRPGESPTELGMGAPLPPAQHQQPNNRGGLTNNSNNNIGALLHQQQQQQQQQLRAMRQQEEVRQRQRMETLEQKLLEEERDELQEGEDDGEFSEGLYDEE